MRQGRTSCVCAEGRSEKFREIAEGDVSSPPAEVDGFCLDTQGLLRNVDTLRLG